MAGERGKRKKKTEKPEKTETEPEARDKKRRHHSVYVVFLRNPRGDGRAGYYVGMTGLTPEERFARHLAGVQAAGIVRRCGVRLVPRLYADLNPMTYAEAVEAEPRLAEELRQKGFLVYGGH